MQSHHIYFPILPGSPYPLCFPQPQRVHKYNLCFPNTPMSPVKITESFSIPSRQKPTTVKLQHLYHNFLRIIFNSFLPKMFLFSCRGGSGGGGKKLLKKPSMSLILNYESGVFYTTTTDASLPITAKNAQITDINMNSSDCPDCGHMHGL